MVFGNFILLLIWLVISAEVAVVLWTPLRGWLGIPEPRASKPRASAPRSRHVELVDLEVDLELVDEALEPVEP